MCTIVERNSFYVLMISSEKVNGCASEERQTQIKAATARAHAQFAQLEGIKAVSV